MIITYSGPTTPREIRKYLMARTKEDIVHEYLRQWREFGKVEEEKAALAAHVERIKSLSETALDCEDGDGVTLLRRTIKDASPATSLARRDSHPDDAAVDRFSVAMKEKLSRAREKGRGGWENVDQCSASMLADMLIAHIGKGNAGTFEDVANFAMMLQQRRDNPAVLAGSLKRLKAEWQAEALEALAQDLAWNADHTRSNGHGDAANYALGKAEVCRKAGKPS